MFGRKKHKDEKREKKKHKPSMSQADLSKLEEVGIRRGFFSKIVKKDKDDGDGAHNHSSSVLQKATKYGQVVRRMSSSASPSPETSPHHFTTPTPPPTGRPMSMQISASQSPVHAPIRSSMYGLPSSYDVPKAPVRKFKGHPIHEYSVPRSTKDHSIKKESSVLSEASGSTDGNISTRLVVLKKREAGDFGLSLRRSAVVEYPNGKAITKTVFFAEPGAVMLADAGYDENNPELLHFGDRLVEIDGVNVEAALREEVVNRIKSASSTVTLLVRTNPEDTLAASKSTISIDSSSASSAAPRAKPRSQPQSAPIREEKLVSEPVLESSTADVKWVKKEQVWLKQAGGIARAHLVQADESSTAGGKIKNVGEGKCRVQLCQNNQLFIAADEDVERVNGVEFDKANDLATLRYLNESSFMHTLAHKYGNGMYYTQIGPHLLSLNHNAPRPFQISKEMTRYKKWGSDEAHVCAIAQQAHTRLMRDNCDQSMVCMGACSKQDDVYSIIHFFLSTYSPPPTSAGRSLNEGTASAIKTIIKSLTWAKTASSLSSCSRSLITHQLVFTKSGSLKSISFQTLLVDYWRVTNRSEGEANFNVFYDLLYGADEHLRKELLLAEGNQHQNNPILFGLFKPTAHFVESRAKEFESLVNAFHAVGITSEQQKALWHIIAVCIHLAMAGYRQVNEHKLQFESAEHAQKAASLLATPIDKLCSAVFQANGAGGTLRGGNRRQSGGAAAFNQNQTSNVEGVTLLNSFICNLYKKALETVVNLTCRGLSCKEMIGKSSIHILDSPGYLNNHLGSASFADFSFNYIQDRLNAFFYRHAVTASRDRYLQEGIQVEVGAAYEEDEGDGLSSGADVVDKPIVQLRGKPSKGMFRLMDEEMGKGGCEPEELVERFHSNSSHNKNEALIVQRSRDKRRFVFRHHNATYPVEYDVGDWLEINQSTHHHHPATIDVLRNSKKYFIAELFGGKPIHQSMGSNSSLNEAASSSTLRRVSSFTKNYASTKTHCAFIKTLVEVLFEKFERSKLHFIISITISNDDNPPQHTPSFDYSLVRRQLQAFRLLDVSRNHKQGFPEHMVMSEFRHRFTVLRTETSDSTSSSLSSHDSSEEQKFANEIMSSVDVNSSQYRIGISEIFLRAGVLAHLYRLRDEKISSRILLLQTICRGHLARRRFEKRKVQDVAIRCLQRNIRLFMNVRQWPWWKLVTKILPLVQVNRAEDEIREKQAELDLTKEKLDRMTKEKEEILETNEKLEHKIEEFMHLLEDEQSTAQHALELLDAETKEKVNLQKENQELNSKVEELEARVKKLASELAASVENQQVMIDVASSRQLRSSQSSNDDEDGVDYKAKYERAIREHNFKMKEKERESEDRMEELGENKKALERKLIQMNEEVDEHVRVENQNKKKMHKLQSELADAKIHLEELSSKNHDLEKKQRKNDSEVNALNKEISELKSARDRFQREKDRAMFDSNSITNDLQDKTEELEIALNKVKFLEQELDESQLRDTDDKQMVNKLKKKVRELEAKVSDQEEELDEQAGTIQTLEQAKERLEMSQDQIRSQHQREIANKDEEYEEFRSSYQKKVKNLEEQIQEGDDERAAQVKQRRQLEQQIFELKENGGGLGGDEQQRQLRKDVKRYKSLLADAQTMIDHLKTNAVNKQQLRQLKTKLEESEYACSAAVKSRKAMELEIEDLQEQLEDISRSKQECESRVSSLQHRVHALQTQVEEESEDAGETLNKYKNLIAQHSRDQQQLIELQNQTEELKGERDAMEEKVTELQSQIDSFDEMAFDRANYNRLEGKVKELEMKLDYQKTASRRLETQLTRAKENTDRAVSERDAQMSIAQREREATKRANKQLRDCKEEQAELVKKELDAISKKHQLELEVEEQTNQVESLQADLKLAFRRIENLQQSLEEFDDSDVDYSGSGSDLETEDSSDYEDDDAPYLTRSRIGSNRSSYLMSPKPRNNSSSSYSSSVAKGEERIDER